MPILLQALWRKARETLEIFWELARVIVPIAILTELLSQLGVIRAVSPFLEPVMGLFGLPPELALAWVTGLLVGIWGAVVLIFALVPASTLSVADMTVFSMLILVAHAIPVEQRIIQKAGPSFILTSLLRILGATLFAIILHWIFSATGWLSSPLDPPWLPKAASAGWWAFGVALTETLAMMLVVLLSLSLVMELLNWAGVMAWLHKVLAPFFRLSGLEAQTVPFATIGLLLGIAYGGGLLIREARSRAIPPRQIFLACVFMGFAHSIVEDTLLVVALGADMVSVGLVRLVLAVTATALVAQLITRIPDRYLFSTAPTGPEDQALESEVAAARK